MSSRGMEVPQTGIVSLFDEPKGLGEIQADDGVGYPFHCTSIADGTRQIAQGTRVVFVPKAGHLGRIEACGITKC
ncbi:MAG TPA: hypothetical protein VEJ87_16820 [Acidimicrobiales bacterium]|nr:hypothetical protein [Acidimicrobiales bacterium]